MSYAVALVRRGLETSHAALTHPPDGQQPEMPEMSPWAGLLVFSTIVALYVLVIAVDYSYYSVVGTLAMIESNHSDAYVAVDTLPSDHDQDGTHKRLATEPLLEPEIVLMKSTPITTSIRRTINYLRAKYGYLSRFRGLSLFLCLCYTRAFIAQLFTTIPFIPNTLGLIIGSFFADLALARWHLTWIHIVISKPTAQKWWRRIPPLNSWAKIAPAVALASGAHAISAYIPWLIAKIGALTRIQIPNYEPTSAELNAVLAQLFPIANLPFILLLQLPATVVLVRVAASMLPEENETVVPFDRSFGGKLNPAITGGQGKIGMLEAWKSFGWSSRIRLVKLVAKTLAILIALVSLMITVLITEAYLIMGPKDVQAMMGALASYTAEH